MEMPKHLNIAQTMTNILKIQRIMFKVALGVISVRMSSTALQTNSKMETSDIHQKTLQILQELVKEQDGIVHGGGG